MEANQKAAKPSLAFQLGLSLRYKQFHSWCGEVEVVALLRDRASLRSVGMPGGVSRISPCPLGGDAGLCHHRLQAAKPHVSELGLGRSM